MRNFLLAMVLGTASLGFSQINYDAAYSKFKINANIGVSFTDFNSKTDADVNFTLGAKGIYFLNPVFGIHAGLDFSPLKADTETTLGDTELTATYIDIPIGITIDYNLFPDRSIYSMIDLGMFIGIPVGDLEVNGEFGDVDYDTDVVFGLNIGYSTFVTLNENMSLGFNIFYKLAFSDVSGDLSDDVGEDSDFRSIGIGAALSFL